MNLSELKKGQRAQVRTITPNNQSLRARFLAMGLTPGASVLLKKIAPLGDPLQVETRGFLLSLRKSEAQHIQIEVMA